MLPTVVMVPVHPLLDPSDVRIVPASGYSVRSVRMTDGRYLLAWVQNNPRTARRITTIGLCVISTFRRSETLTLRESPPALAE